MDGAALFTTVEEEGQEIAMRWGLTLKSLRYRDLVRLFREEFGVCMLFRS